MPPAVSFTLRSAPRQTLDPRATHAQCHQQVPRHQPNGSRIVGNHAFDLVQDPVDGRVQLQGGGHGRRGLTQGVCLGRPPSRILQETFVLPLQPFPLPDIAHQGFFAFLEHGLRQSTGRNVVQHHQTTQHAPHAVVKHCRLHFHVSLVAGRGACTISQGA